MRLYPIKRLGLVGGLLISLLSFPAYGEYVFSIGVRYDRFADNQSPDTDGFEVTIPVGLIYRQERFSLGVETAYSSATVNPTDEPEASLAGFTDTLISASYFHDPPSRPMALYVLLNVNLPSGRARLAEHEARAQAGQSNDLFEVDNFGDGLNIGVNLGVVRDIGNASLVLQGSYIYNGKYDPTRDVEEDDLDPGDQLMGLTVLSWQVSPQLALNAFLTASYFSPDTVNGDETFQEANNVVIGGDARYDRPPLGITFSLQSTMSGKCKKRRDGTLHTETANSHGTDVFGLIQITYQASDTLRLRLLGDIRYYGESEAVLETTGEPVEGRRVRYAIGPGIAYSLSEHLTCRGLLKYFTMTQEPDSIQEEEVTSQGVNLDLRVLYTF